ncbi:MAG TPA: GTP-binding protein [Solirubrobacteraceae bacterium]|nr:GTP-binding protein [Solirubrobacteraceae bacterium]
MSVAAAVLNLLEDATRREEARELLVALGPGALGGEAAGHIVGVTGPPGVGKSTLLGALVATWRAAERTVAVLAVDPSSKRSGGALLGDRIRIAGPAAGGPGRFIRSMASRERVGGLAAATRAATQVLAVAFDVVVVDTVGGGQSETEVAELADTVVVVVQPGAGDALQFLKAGVMEVPDVLVVAKADVGAAAQATLAEARAALHLLGADDTATLAVSALPPGVGIAELAQALDDHRARIDTAARRLATRRAGALAEFISEYGARGLRAVGGRRGAERILIAQSPDIDGHSLVEILAAAQTS